MRIVALATHQAASRLRMALTASDILLAAGDARQFRCAMERHSDAMAVISPHLLDMGEMEQVTTFLRDSGQPFLVYSHPACRSARTIVQLLNAGASGVIVEDSDEWPVLCRAILERMPFSTPATELLRRIGERIAGLPADIAMSAISAFASSRRGVDVPKRIASGLGRTRRTMDRWMVRVGLSSLSTVLNIARFVRTLPSLRPRAETRQRVALNGGYGSAGVLQRHCLAVTGLSLAAVEEASDVEIILQRMASRMLDNR